MIDRASVVGVIHALDRRNNYVTIDFFPKVITTKQRWFWRRHQDVSSSNFTKHEGYTIMQQIIMFMYLTNKINRTMDDSFIGQGHT